AALNAGQEAVDLFRPLAAELPEAFESDLAGSLANLAEFLGDRGRGQAALQTAQEAADLYRRLASARPGAFVPSLAGSLSNLANRLSDAGQDERAFATVHEAITIMAPHFLSLPAAFATTTLQILKTYNGLAPKLARKLDMTLLEPIILKLAELQR